MWWVKDGRPWTQDRRPWTQHAHHPERLAGQTRVDATRVGADTKFVAVCHAASVSQLVTTPDARAPTLMDGALATERGILLPIVHKLDRRCLLPACPRCLRTLPSHTAFAHHAPILYEYSLSMSALKSSQWRCAATRGQRQPLHQNLRGRTTLQYKKPSWQGKTPHFALANRHAQQRTAKHARP